jgi:Fe-S-cluster containining protein
MRKVIPLSVIRQHEADPKKWEAAQRRADVVTKRLKLKQGEINALMRKAQDADDTDDVIKIMRQVMDIIGAAMKNVAPCGAGCSSCCHIPVMISYPEAVLIGQEIGRPPTPIQYTLERNDSYTGTPCPFLKKGNCSIYKSRPLVCRMQYSMAGDDVLCTIYPGESIKVPYFNLKQFEVAQLKAIGPEHFFSQGDLRDWFPQGEK